MKKNWFQRNKKWAIPVAIVLVTAIIVGILASTTNMIGKITNSNIGGFRERNEDNLIDANAFKAYDGKKIQGVKFDVDKDGVITLNGEANGDVDLSIELDLKSYPLLSDSIDYRLYFTGCLDGSIDTYHLSFTDPNGVVFFNINDSYRCVVSGGMSGDTHIVTIGFTICDGTELNNVKFYPGLYTEADASFYAK